MDVFGDLLGSQGYDFAKRDTGPKTMNAMRKEEMVKEMDPDKLKIHEWVCLAVICWGVSIYQYAYLRIFLIIL